MRSYNEKLTSDVKKDNMKKVLFTTPVGEKPDYFYISVRRDYFTFSLPTPPFGLLFLKENVPDIEILEYPSWEEFKNEVKDVDILGISYYMADIPVAKKMIEIARGEGVEEIWGGNYGVLCDETHELFDKTFKGYSENRVREELGMDKLDELTHPNIITRFGLKKTPLSIKHAFLFTTRGCGMRCKFCQTPWFIDGISKLSLKSVDDVLKRYAENEVQSVFIMDDNFFQYRDYSEKVIDLFPKHGLNWGVCTRAERLKGRVKEFRDKGMFMCIIGIESMRQENLNKINKNISLDILIETVKELDENDIYIHGTYMIGYPSDTEESIKEDIDRLSKLGINSLQISILTPYPHTPLWEEIDEKYGIYGDYEDFDAYHLVWDHPNISREKMHELRDYAWEKCYPSAKILKAFMKVVKRGLFWSFVSP